NGFPWHVTALEITATLLLGRPESVGTHQRAERTLVGPDHGTIGLRRSLSLSRHRTRRSHERAPTQSTDRRVAGLCPRYIRARTAYVHLTPAPPRRPAPTSRPGRRYG